MYYVILYDGQLYSTNVIVCTVAIAPSTTYFLPQIICSCYNNIIHIIYVLKLKLYLHNDQYVVVRYLNMWSFEVKSNISTIEVYLAKLG